MKPIRLLVVGVGHMGSLHVRKIASLRDEGEAVELAGIVDLDPLRAQSVGAGKGVGSAHVPTSTVLRELLPHADAAIVSVPTVHHYDVTKACLEAGLHVLVEKPLTATLPEAEKLLSQARDFSLVLRVGHLEWFNSAMRAVEAMVEAPRFFEGHRIGPFQGRATDVDVVRDLMIHDIDIVQRLVGAEPVRVDAIGVPVISDAVDIANARLTFASGAVANLTASRVSTSSMRKLRFFQPDGYFSIDFQEQSVAVFRRLRDAQGAEIRIDARTLEFDHEDALVTQLHSFLDAVRGNSEGEIEPGEALRALRTALRIIDAMPPLDPAS